MHTGTTIISIKLPNYIVVAVDSRLSTIEQGILKVYDIGEKLWGLHTPLVGTISGYIQHCVEAIRQFEQEIKQGKVDSLTQAADRLKKIVRNISFTTPNNESSAAQIILPGFDEGRRPRIFGISSFEYEDLIDDRDGYLAGGAGVSMRDIY
ncbi:hypothetical protein DM860_008729 [Cuscuta australis]|uniref:Uncharacterized protein n=1 Tax=Cuscuta australis TaxID=267555 RepID=A0A328D9P0_9ASTE|nr:hypothetical protein DM860_008729 [Cuscuta australis]